AGVRLMSAPPSSAPALPLPRRRGRSRLWMGLYQLLFLLVLVGYAPVLLWRCLGDRRYRARFFQRVGFVPWRGDGRPVVWIHGVSVGEVKAASNFVAELRRRRPDLQLVVSTTTATGHLVAQKEYPDLPVVFY